MEMIWSFLVICAYVMGRTAQQVQHLAADHYRQRRCEHAEACHPPTPVVPRAGDWVRQIEAVLTAIVATVRDVWGAVATQQARQHTAQELRDAWRQGAAYALRIREHHNGITPAAPSTPATPAPAPAPVPIPAPPKQDPPPPPRLRVVQPPTPPKEKAMTEITTREQFLAAMNELIQEAQAELEDAQGDLGRAKEFAAHVDLMANSLRDMQVDGDVIAKVAELAEDAPLRQEIAQARVDRCEQTIGKAQAALSALNASTQNAFYNG